VLHDLFQPANPAVPSPSGSHPQWSLLRRRRAAQGGPGPAVTDSRSLNSLAPP
jgi:hypothetical protein